jgi:hypothetical protein
MDTLYIYHGDWNFGPRPIFKGIFVIYYGKYILRLLPIYNPKIKRKILTHEHAWWWCAATNKIKSVN